MDAYEQVRIIGKGSFGVVTQIVRKSDRKMLVWKEVNYGAMSEKEKQLIVSEVNILRELRHPHIVRYLDRVIDKQATKIYIVMEYCEGGDLGQFIKRKKREGSYIEEGFIWHIFTHIFLALKECHRHREGNAIRPILHRDIKPGNIFLDSNNNAKLGDFGLAKELSSESRFAQTNVGTPYYMSPEMVNEMTYDDRSDIWALGCLLYEMATLGPPFDATNQLALAKKINAGKFTRIPSQYSEGLFQVIRWMLHRQRSRRPRIEDLERVPQLQQRLRAYAAANAPQPVADPNLQTSYNQKMKELLGIEEDLRRQEAALMAREKKLKELEVDYMRRESELKKREQMVEMMTRKLSYNTAKVGSPTTSDDSNSSADNNFSHGGSQSPKRRGDNNMAGSGGSPPARSARQTTLADFQSQSSGELNAKVEEAPRSTRGGYPAKGQSSPYYGPTGDVSSTPASGNRLRDAPEQVANLMKGMWRKNN
ncbi:Serine/threonine-protein kinase [Phytophthora rubi]|uniref:non-specific serine/threonine protein kinase n=1 Tax=Phytophthora rubi TaxID=129364 RepID=A0A6A3NVT8_9STRA|nr:Serine/threonine-protein kinase [Phytophthora rubi]KAE9052020.1 Serine/threonine-protein kinase [Phytophthora rubi]KAE9332012.1 Serine/threonine-protein kinase [Phytophthora rubi]